jgi:hypothetical protein
MNEEFNILKCDAVLGICSDIFCPEEGISAFLTIAAKFYQTACRHLSEAVISSPQQ